MGPYVHKWVIFFRKYNVRRTTANLKVPYFVKDSFNTDFTGQLRK
jgi:hypothetical protein